MTNIYWKILAAQDLYLGNPGYLENRLKGRNNGS